MIPLVIAAVILGLTAVQSGYNIYKTNESTKISDKFNKQMSGFYGASLSENTAYWARYIRAHHLEDRRILYPYRTGKEMNPSSYLSSINSLDLNAIARQSAYVNGALNTGKSAAYGYAAGKMSGVNKEPLYPYQTTQSPRTTLIDTSWKYKYGN